MAQVKFVEDSLWKILFGPFLNTLSHKKSKYSVNINLNDKRLAPNQVPYETYKGVAFAASNFAYDFVRREYKISSAFNCT